MTDDFYKDFTLALEAAQTDYAKALRSMNGGDERGTTRHIFSSLKDYINKLIAELKKLIANARETAMINVRKAAVKSDVKNALKAADSKFGKNFNGYTTSCPDFNRYAVEIAKASDKVWKEAERIINKKYVDISDLDNDLERFEVIYNEGMEAISNATKLKTTMDIDEFRAMCNNELKGDSLISRTVADSMHKMKKAEINLKYMESRRDSMEYNRIIPHKYNVIQRILARIARFCSSIWKGFVGMTCFLTS